MLDQSDRWKSRNPRKSVKREEEEEERRRRSKRVMERLRGLPRRAARGGTLLCRFSSTASTSSSSSSSSSSHREVTSSLSRKRYAVVGSGFAGLAVCYNLLRNALSSTKACPIVVDLFDAHGKAGGGASSVAAGLLHPLNTRGNVTWKGKKKKKHKKKKNRKLILLLLLILIMI